MDENNNVVENQEEKVFPFWQILYKNLLLIIIITVICGALGTAAGFVYAKPVYTASSNIMLKVTFDNGSNNAINNNTLSKRTLPTVADTISSPDIINAARKLHDDDGIYAKNISVEYDSNSLIFSIGYVDDNETDAKLRLADIITAVKTEFKDRHSTTFTDIEFVETQSEYKITITNKLAMYIVIGFVGGAVAGVIVAILVFVLDNKVKDCRELEELTDSSVIAVIENND